MKKVIVSGANGFVGGALVKELTAHGIQVIALDLEGHTDNLPDSPLVKFYPFNLIQAEKAEQVIKERDGQDPQVRPGRILHCSSRMLNGR